MNIMNIVNIDLSSNSYQSSDRYIKEAFGVEVILWFDPLSFHHPPKCLCNVQVEGIWRDIKEEGSSLFPDGAHLPNSGIPMHTGIVKDNECPLGYLERVLVKKIDNFFSVYRLTSDFLDASILIFIPICILFKENITMFDYM